MKTRQIFLLITMSTTLLVQAQWYFETGVNGTKFSEYVNLSGTQTILHSYNGFRDFSYALGYTFPLKSLEQRIASNGQASLFRLGVGVGFDQMNLRTLASVGSSDIPVNYYMGQAKAELNILFTPTLISKNDSESGLKRPILNLLVEGGVAYNKYTYATRSYFFNKGHTADLTADDSFTDAYPTYSFAGGLEFPISPQTTIYGKYVSENAFSLGEDGNSGAQESFSMVKHRVMIGIRMDYTLKNRIKENQNKRIAELETKVSEMPEPVNLDSVFAKIDSLETELKNHKHNQKVAIEELASKQEAYTVKDHHKGFMYLPQFKRVLFPIKSSYFDKKAYGHYLENLALFIKAHPQYDIKLVGYADGKTGTPAFNKPLSKRRAKSVYDHLKRLGVKPERMQYVGGGETLQFSIDELNENRRTEIIILKR